MSKQRDLYLELSDGSEICTAADVPVKFQSDAII